MKNISALKGTLLFVVLLMTPTLLLTAQNSRLPKNLSLSFNGTFTNELTNFIDQKASDNGIYLAKYDVGEVTDENREIKNFRLYKNNTLLYSKKRIPGADFYISNAGFVAVMDHDMHFKQELSVHIFDPSGVEVLSETFRYASVFGFSPLGKQFVCGTDKFLEVINCETKQSYKATHASEFAFSENETLLAVAFENELHIYKNGAKIQTINTGFTYPRAITISGTSNFVSIIDKKNLQTWSLQNYQLIDHSVISGPLSYRDLRIINGKIMAGVHFRFQGVSKGLLYQYAETGLEKTEEIAEKKFQTFDNNYKSSKNSLNYETIPWPFVPFNEVHKVWNHYEQHMGDGSGDWAYLHQGLDLETPIAEPTYAVQPGVVKLVLTLGGDIYWRLAVAPEQSSGYSDGWLYAHLIESSIQVDVGDEVELHDYLGDIIAWTSTWGHIHFVNIHDHGTVWYYDDDEWGINFNPLLALDPITDASAPVIDDFSGSSKFGFIANQTTAILDPTNLSGDVDIIARISDFYGTSEWEQPAFVTYYWLNKLPDNTTVFPKTLGQILNHIYPMYNSSFYESYASILYFKDNSHPSPPWMNFTRDYYQILTNNNGDSTIDLSEANLAFKTADFADGMYRLYVEAWDEFGNMAVDSQDIVFDNFNTGIILKETTINELICYPNPVKNRIIISLPDDVNEEDVNVSVFNSQNERKLEMELNCEPSSRTLNLDVQNLTPGMYFIKTSTNNAYFTARFIKL